jgi:flagellin
MSLSLNTNTASLVAQTSLNKLSGRYETSTARLSSGLRINSAKDDAAGLAIASRMESRIRGMQTAQRGVQDVVSHLQSRDSVLSSVTESFQRMRELVVQAKSPVLTTDDTAALQTEFSALGAEVGRMLAAEPGAGFLGYIPVGPVPADPAQPWALSNDEVDPWQALADGKQFLFATDLSHSPMLALADGASGHYGIFKFAPHQAAGLDSDPSRSDGNIWLSDPEEAIRVLDSALEFVAAERANNGAFHSRLDSIINNLSTSLQSEEAARGRIVDADYAKETLALSKANVLQQAGMSMLAQANQQPQAILSLLR